MQAFEKCGLFPINADKVLERIPSRERTEEIAANVDQILLKTLEVRRFDTGTKTPRGPKVPAGRSYTTLLSDSEDSSTGTSPSSAESEEEDIDTDEEEKLARKKGKGIPGKKGIGIKNPSYKAMKENQDREEVVARKKVRVIPSRKPEGHSEEDVNREQEEAVRKKEKGKGKSSKVGAQETQKDTGTSAPNMEADSEELLEPGKPTSSWNSGSLVVAVYEGEWFVAEILKDQTDVPRGYVFVSYSSP